MIIVKLRGGLGNQMFEYALARRISVEKNMQLKLDVSFLEAEATDHTKRDLELRKFNINADIATDKEIMSIRKQGWRNLFYPVWIKDKGIDKFQKKNIQNNDLYLDGYWQNERYFESISNIIRSEFTFKIPLIDEYSLNIKEQITKSNSVSIHFRRGDYIDNTKVNHHHGVCSLSYYERAIDEISKLTVNPNLFIFSDDIQWVKENLRSDLPMTFIEHSNNELHSDFRLMSLCKHNIIANSSYSWWAAWLNNNKDKIVIAPEKWYNNERSQLRSLDMVPISWIKL